MTMMTIAICDDMQADARRLHKQLERIVPGSEIRIFKSGELLLEELEKKRKPAENDSFHIGEHVIPISRSYNRNAHEKYDEYLRLQQEYDEEEED